jgi:hypothetical protein
MSGHMLTAEARRSRREHGEKQEGETLARRRFLDVRGNGGTDGEKVGRRGQLGGGGWGLLRRELSGMRAGILRVVPPGGKPGQRTKYKKRPGLLHDRL